MELNVLSQTLHFGDVLVFPLPELVDGWFNKVCLPLTSLFLVADDILDDADDDENGGDFDDNGDE